MSERVYPRTAAYAGVMLYRVRYEGAIPEFQKDDGGWAQSQDFLTERHLFTNPNVLETTPSNQFKRLREWLDDAHRKPPHLAFTAGPEREIADRITTMIEVHCEAVTKPPAPTPDANLIAAAREAVKALRQLTREGVRVIDLDNDLIADALAAALDAYAKGGAK